MRSVPSMGGRMTRIARSTFTIRDRGKPGRGPKILPTLKKGALGVSFDAPPSVRRRIEAKLTKRIGEKKVIGKLRALQVLNKRTNPALSSKAAADSRYIAGSFEGRKRVGYPMGFR